MKKTFCVPFIRCSWVNHLGVKWFETLRVSSSQKIRDLPNDPEACQWTLF